MKIYIVTQGEYSDYGIVACFSTRELADILVSKLEDTRVEEFEVDPVDPRKTGTPYIVWMDKSGNSKHSHGNYNLVDCLQGRYYFNAHNDLVYHVLAKDEIHAVKIVNEKRIQILANNLWGQDK